MHEPSASPPRAGLRQRAELQLRRRRAADGEVVSNWDLQKALHELQVHEVELQMQNDELERLHAEARCERDRYAGLFDAAPVGFVQIDAEGRLLEVNRAAARLLGRRTQDLIGHPLVDFVAITGVAALSALLAGQDPQFRGAVLELEAKDARQGPRKLRIERAPAQAGQPVLLSLVDIFERRQAETLVLGGIHALEQATRTRRELMAGLGRELQMPLTAVIGASAQLLGDDSRRLDDGQRLQVERIRQAGEHLHGLVGNLLDIGRLESGGLALNLGAIDFAAVVRAALVDAASSAQSAAVELVDEGPATGVPTVQADALRLRQVVDQLLAHAISRSRTGSVVRIACGAAAAGMVSVRVIDGGRGVSDDLQPDAEPPSDQPGDPFAALRGASLGLYASRLLVAAMNGTLRLECRPGQGCSVILSLPLAPN
ncbi:MAG: ATP-binding protein [Rubrivivax sp.]|nr:ATP-binding protein [Rubrivivax sp.]MDP3082428.1 ATP-binding protein [Rubrivivax sp.]